MIFKVKTINLQNGGIPICFLTNEEAYDNGISLSDSLEINFKEKKYIFSVVLSDEISSRGYITISENIIPTLDSGSEVDVNILIPPKSLTYIKNKFRGKKLTYEKAYSLMSDIANDRLGDIGKTYFASLGYAPGFDDTEIYNLTRAMANSGEMIEFQGIVVDKHSIGGVAGKGITPIVVSIVSSCGLTIPNTSTRAITTPAGTTDILEVIMNMSFNEEQIKDLVEETGACMVWGGSLALAPADDRLIRVENVLNYESYDKMLISIMAKKAAMGIKYLLLDLPVGVNTKIKKREDILRIKDKFELLAHKLGIVIDIYERRPKGIDGNGVGPILETREFMKILEQRSDRSYSLEQDAANMAARLIELSGKYRVGEGIQVVTEKLRNLSALSKFKEIVKLQGGNSDLTSDDIEVSPIHKDIFSSETGIIRRIYNSKLVTITKILGAPHIKEAGIYFHKNIGDRVEKGEKLLTLYSSHVSRFDLINEENLFKMFLIR